LLISKAENVVFSALPPEKLADDPSDWRCKFCSYFAVCHGCKIPEVSCRTCSHVTPERDGTWSCAKGKPAVTCDDHLYIPQIMPSDLVLVDAGDDFVDYEDQDSGEVIRNQGNSREIFAGRMIMTFELRDYQREAVDGLYNYWAGKAGENPLIVAPTGSGKTAIIAQIVKDAWVLLAHGFDFGARQGAFGAGCGWIEAIIPRG
jgi:hypothetical protein